MNVPKLVAVYSPARQHGKSTVAEVLRLGFGYGLFKFAGPIYAMWYGLCQDAGLSTEQIAETISGSLKETPLAVLGGLSFRNFAEGVGTKWGRDSFSKTLWVDIARAKLRAGLDKGHIYVVDDLRFANEYHVIRDLGGLVVKVWRPGAAEPSLPSEGHLLHQTFDAVFTNDGTIEQLQGKVREWLVLQPARNVVIGPWTSSLPLSR